MKKLSKLFEKKQSFGLRGDDVLWNILKEKAGEKEVETKEEARKWIYDTIKEIIKIDLLIEEKTEVLYIESLKQGRGISDGGICPYLWNGNYIPSMLELL